MVGLTVDAARTRTPHARKSEPLDRAETRGFWDALLWGAALETCTECGAEVTASHAYRQSATQVYCSLEHARRDLEE